MKGITQDTDRWTETEGLKHCEQTNNDRMADGANKMANKSEAKIEIERMFDRE